ncbi:hypothetical protein F4821DRAFT_218298 [Hypoxylon rubiginosum]|uniref:Uncharacterized protein n=1 Tax=Hypoxylon rubiginosum TaxID=110542 RepID=A0ACC0CPJ0_9PEZI|nr:hypothetical protein F4821DRAFT_218298 [Hypoxylon rubiginosum]
MATTDLAKPLILLVSLNLLSFFDETYASLLTQLSSKATVKRIKKQDSVIRLLSEGPRPSAVLVTDEALTREENSGAWEAVLQYVRQGGTSVVMGHYSSFVQPDDIKPFFAKAGLPWKSASYQRTTLVLNREAVGDSLAACLPPRYSQKALSVDNVARADAWYVTDEDSVVESMVFAPTSANVVGESPVVFARVGDGKLGYIGDVNAEEGSTTVVLAMCRLLS